jgi:hypothetical protein
MTSWPSGSQDSHAQRVQRFHESNTTEGDEFMSSISDLERAQTPHATSPEGPGRQTTKGDHQSDAGVGTIVALSPQHSALSPDEIDDQIRRFFDARQF